MFIISPFVSMFFKQLICLNQNPRNVNRLHLVNVFLKWLFIDKFFFSFWFFITGLLSFSFPHSGLFKIAFDITWLTYRELTHPFICQSLQEVPSYSASINRKDVLTHIAWSGPRSFLRSLPKYPRCQGITLSTADNLFQNILPPKEFYNSYLAGHFRSLELGEGVEKPVSGLVFFF